MPIREKTILVGLYLSKFDTDGLTKLGFSNFTEAFNTIGLALGVRPASIKNYRDEFDPLFPNGRQGWHKRVMRKYCKEIYDSFGSLDIKTFSNFLRETIYENYEIDILLEQVTKKEGDESSFAKRLVTGQAAEHYFRKNYSSIDIFKKYEIEDTTQYGCGFDFKLHSPNSEFVGVEVKGLHGVNGTITLTDKEYSVAQLLGGRYFLFVVKNFKETPSHNYFQDPLKSTLQFDSVSRQITQISWNTFI